MIDKIAYYFSVIDFKNAFELIIRLLKENNKGDYLFIISNLTKVSILENDLSFRKVIDELKDILRKDYKFDVKRYSDTVKELINENSNDNRKLSYYIDILEKAKALDLDIDTKYELYELLDEIERKLEKKNEEKDPEIEEGRALLKEKHEILLNNGGGILLLEKMPKERRKMFYNLSREYTDISIFSIGEENPEDVKPIVIRYKSPLYKRLDFQKWIKEANEAYRNKEYQKCAELNLELLKYGNPNNHVYASVGLAYIKLRDYKKALLYITVAYGLALKGKKSEALLKRYRTIIQGLMYESSDINLDKEADKIFELKSSKKLHKTMIEEGCYINGIDFHSFIAGLEYARIDINRVVLANTAEYTPEVFRELVYISIEALKCKEYNVPYYMPNNKTININGEVRINLIQLIKTIKKKIDYTDLKPTVDVQEKDFTSYRSPEDFGFEKFDLLHMYISEYNLSIEEAASKIGLSDEEINIARLIYAKEYYAHEFYEKGDEFVKCVEQTKDKSPKLKRIISEVKANKKFYKNRTEESKGRALSLKLRPREKRS